MGDIVESKTQDVLDELRRAITTASNDRYTGPQTEKLARHKQRLAAMLTAIEEIARLRTEKVELVSALAKIHDETLTGVSHGLGDRIYRITATALSRARAEGDGT